jgi:hypothetical protein
LRKISVWDRREHVMHPLVAEDFAKVLVEERLAQSERRAMASNRRPPRRLRRAIGSALVKAGTALLK